MHKSASCVSSFMGYFSNAVHDNLQPTDASTNNVSPQVDSFIIGIQEPPVHRSRIHGFDRSHKLHYAPVDQVRAALYTSSNLKSWPMPEFTNRDMATCTVKVGSPLKEIVVSSIYMDITKPVWPEAFRSLVNRVLSRNQKLLVLADTNSHSTLWGCPESNSRGEEFEMNLVGSDLEIINVGTNPTFYNYRAATIIDVTLASSQLSHHISNWRVNESFSGSDHCLIDFDLTISVQNVIEIRNWIKGDWSSFQKRMEEKAATPTFFHTCDSLEAEAQKLAEDIWDVLNVTHPPYTVPLRLRLPHWWNEEAANLQRQVKQSCSLYRRHRTPEASEQLKQDRRKFTRYCRRIKRQSWQKFTEECGTPKAIARLNRIIQKKERVSLGILKQPDGAFCSSAEETLELLIQSHFPGNKRSQLTHVLPPSRRCDLLDDRAEFFTPEAVAEAIKSFGSHKAPGPDGIKPLILQHLGPSMLCKLADMFKASALLGYIPTAWRTSKVIFIPKPGKSDYTQVRSFRPISLCSFVLKTMEKVWNWHLQDTALRDNPLRANQHAFRRGYSTESAISNMVEYIEAALVRQEFALGVFLDIQGAFDNVSVDSVCRGMKNQNLPSLFQKWYKHLLTHRKITAEHQGSTVIRSLTRGTPQGGVLSPTAWNLSFESFLALYDDGPVRACGFADDGGLVITGDQPAYLRHCMQQAVDKAVLWGRQHGLQFSAAKTVVVLFTRKRKFDLPSKLIVSDQEIPYSDQARYLGLQLDSKLSWKPHVIHKIKHCKKLLFQASQAVGKLWGPHPKAMKWLFNGIVRPSLCYGALAWVGALKMKGVCQKLTSLQRLSLMSLGHFRRSTPTAGLEILSGQPPLDLWIWMEAAMGYRRTRGHRKLEAAALFTRIRSRVGHRQLCREFITDLDLEIEEEDTIPQEHNWSPLYQVEKSTFKHGDVSPPEESTMYVFTDGSQLKSEHTGAGFVSFLSNQEQHSAMFSLPNESTVFQAEITAIHKAAEYLSALPFPNPVIIYSDSQAALSALAKRTYSSRTVERCIQHLNRAAGLASVKLRWVRAHVGHPGNERADELAKTGAMAMFQGTIRIPSLPTSPALIRLECKKLLLAKWTERWQARSDCRQTKQWFPTPNPLVAKQLMRLTRRSFSTIVQIITGHNYMNRHNAVVGDTDDPLCRLCMEDEESTLHIVAECPALARHRQEIFEVPFLETPLHWTDQMSAFLSGTLIGRLLGLEGLEAITFEVAADGT